MDSKPLTDEAIGIKASNISNKDIIDSLNPYYALAKYLEIHTALNLLIKNGHSETEEADALREESEIYWCASTKNKVTETKMKELAAWISEEINPYNESER